jgi:hypothetical protein
MIRTKLMLLGLCAALSCAMAFGAGGAQAAKWLILMSNGEVLTGEQLKAEVGGKLESSTTVLHAEILKVKFLVVCTGLNTKGVFLEGAGKVTEGGRVEFTGCTAETNGSPNANCKPKAGGGASGTIMTNEGKGQLVLHEGGVGLTKIEPKTGTTFVTLEMSEACPVGEKVQINGVLYIKDCQNMVELHLKEHLWEEGPLTDLWMTATKNAEHTAHLLGSVWFFLTAAHTGLAWGGLPE